MHTKNVNVTQTNHERNGTDASQLAPPTEILPHHMDQLAPVVPPLPPRMGVGRGDSTLQNINGVHLSPYKPVPPPKPYASTGNSTTTDHVISNASTFSHLSTHNNNYKSPSSSSSPSTTTNPKNPVKQTLKSLKSKRVPTIVLSGSSTLGRSFKFGDRPLEFVKTSHLPGIRPGGSFINVGDLCSTGGSFGVPLNQSGQSGGSVVNISGLDVFPRGGDALRLSTRGSGCGSTLIIRKGASLPRLATSELLDGFSHHNGTSTQSTNPEMHNHINQHSSSHQQSVGIPVGNTIPPEGTLAGMIPHSHQNGGVNYPPTSSLHHSQFHHNSNSSPYMALPMKTLKGPSMDGGNGDHSSGGLQQHWGNRETRLNEVHHPQSNQPHLGHQNPGFQHSQDALDYNGHFAQMNGQHSHARQSGRRNGANPNHNGAIGNQNGGIGNHNGGIGNHNGGIGNHNGGIGNHNGGIGNHNGGIGNHNGGIGNYNGGIGNHNGAMGNHNGAFDGQNGGIGNHNGGISVHNSPIGKSNGAIGNQNGPYSQFNGYNGLNGNSAGFNGNTNGLSSMENRPNGNVNGLNDHHNGLNGIISRPNGLIQHQSVNGPTDTQTNLPFSAATEIISENENQSSNKKADRWGNLKKGWSIKGLLSSKFTGNKNKDKNNTTTAAMNAENLRQTPGQNLELHHGLPMRQSGLHFNQAQRGGSTRIITEAAETRRAGSFQQLNVQHLSEQQLLRRQQKNLSADNLDALPSDQVYGADSRACPPGGSSTSDSGRFTAGSQVRSGHNTSLDSSGSRQQTGQESGNDSEWVDINDPSPASPAAPPLDRNSKPLPPLPKGATKSFGGSSHAVSNAPLMGTGNLGLNRSGLCNLSKRSLGGGREHQMATPPLPPLSPELSPPFNRGRTGSMQYNRSKSSSALNQPDVIDHTANGIAPSLPTKPYDPRLPPNLNLPPLVSRHSTGHLDTDTAEMTENDAFDMDSMIGATTEITSDEEGYRPNVTVLKRQLEGLEGMYGEVLKLLGNNNGRKLKTRRRLHGSMSSLPSSIVSNSRGGRERRKNGGVTDMGGRRGGSKGVEKRFQRLESHVVTLARSVAHLSTEMRQHNNFMQEMEAIRTDLAALRSSNLPQNLVENNPVINGAYNKKTWDIFNNQNMPGLNNPGRVKKLRQFFGDEPPLVRLFLKKLGYEKYAPIFEKEKIGMLELPYLNEEKLTTLGIPLGPRARILQEAQGPITTDGSLSVYVV